jgi:hypothetical protein
MCRGVSLTLQTSDFILSLTSTRLPLLFITFFKKEERKDDEEDGGEMMATTPTHASVHTLPSLRGRITAVRAEPSIVGAWHMLS